MSRFVLSTSLLFFLAAPSSAAEKLNVLFVVSDDLNCDLGCYGHPQVKSPAIDRLAEEGVRFQRAYCSYPLCSPSRSSFLTGRRPNHTGVVRNPGLLSISPHFREFIPNTVTLPQSFKNNGYFSARVGKLYHYNVPRHIGTDGLDDPESWDQTVNPRGIDKEAEADIITLRPGQYGGTLSWLAIGDEMEHTDAIGTTEAIKLLEQNKDRPFFLAVGLFRPHTPYVAPQSYFDLYPLDSIELAEVPENHKDGVPPAAFASAKKEQDQMTDAQRREAIQAYYASTTLVDTQVGRLMKALERLNLREKTVIVLTSDHGYHLGEHGLWQKSSLFEGSARVPLIISAPGLKGKGRVAQGPAELIDLYPTLAELCGLKSPDNLDGVSLVPALNDPERDVREAAFTQMTRGNFDGVSVRDRRWRYTEWDGGKRGIELYDHENDPKEYRNLAGNSDYSEMESRMKALIQKHWDPKRVQKRQP